MTQDTEERQPTWEICGLYGNGVVYILKDGFTSYDEAQEEVERIYNPTAAGFRDITVVVQESQPNS